MPAKYKPLADMVAPSIKDWKGVANNTKVSFQKRMKVEYKGKSYTASYAKRKSEGTAVRRKKDEKAGIGQLSRSVSPDLTLTGNMLKEITATSTGTSAKIEWTGANAAKIIGLDRGRFPMFSGSEPASSKVRKDIDKYVNELYDKRVKEQTQRVVFKV